MKILIAIVMSLLIAGTTAGGMGFIVFSMLNDTYPQCETYEFWETLSGGIALACCLAVFILGFAFHGVLEDEDDNE